MRDKYRFFYHYRRSTGGMTIHFKNSCIPVKDVKCLVPCETKRNKIQSKLVLQGFCKEVTIIKNIGIIK